MSTNENIAKVSTYKKYGEKFIANICSIFFYIIKKSPDIGEILLREEAMLMLLIKSNPGQPVKYYVGESRISYRAFYNNLNKLIEMGLVDSVTDEIDGRVRRLY